jgi:two-component system clock-associated histidine kinase SasA
LVLPLVVDSGQRLKFDLSNGIPPVNLDGDMILRVVVNLLENALKYTPKEGTIQLNVELISSGKEVRIIVRDSGPGIPRHMQKQIFDKFSRVKYHDAPKGVGLGLAFCRLAVEAHNGEIWVESEVGEGSAFIFTLPMHNEAVTQEMSIEQVEV